MVWNVQKCKEKFFPLWGGVRGVRGWWGGSASSEDQIGVNFLSVFSFSREKSFFFQICLECAETSRNEKKKKKKKLSTFWRGEGLKSQKVENSTFFIFFFLTPSLRERDKIIVWIFSHSEKQETFLRYNRKNWTSLGSGIISLHFISFNLSTWQHCFE